MKKSKILITGGTGFLGKNLAFFFKDKFEVYICGRNIGNGIEAKELIKKIHFIPLNISNFDNSYTEISKIKPDIIIHAAASKFVDISEKYPDECVSTNINGSSNIYKIAKILKCKKLIAISSDKASPPYKNIYGLTKATMERQMILNNQKSNLKLSIVRFGNLAWSTGSVFPIWEAMIKKNNKILSTGPEMTRFFYKVQDAIKLINFVLKNINRFNNSVVIPELKKAKIKEFLDILKREKNISWKKIKARKMDKVHEDLISNYEYNLFKKEKTKIGNLFILKNFYNLSFSKKNINSSNAKNLSKNEIKDIILKKPKIL